MTEGGVPPLVAAMLEPSFYPHAPERVELLESHVSWVLRADELAYKVRKPVVFPFLDYGTVERRRHMAEEEIRLGRRLAPDVYLGLRAVARADGGFVLADPDAPFAVEPVVEMRSIDRERTLAALLARGEATAGDLERVGRRVAAFHAAADRAPAGTFGERAVAATVGENFSTLLPFADELGPRELAAAHRFAAAFLHGRRLLLARRAVDGHVRDCHGDLRAEHVLVGAEIEVYDPLEFDPSLRLIDVAADLAFLVMELHAAGAPALAEALVRAYEKAGGDSGGDALLSFYAAYRAWVRVKVACLRADELPEGADRRHALDEARRLVPVAGALAWRARRPLTLVVCGRAATGKTALAEELSARAGLPVLGSDPVRKELAGVQPRERLVETAYGEETSRRVYRELGARAAVAAAAGGVLVDATFRRRSHRDAFSAGYGDGQPPLYVECVAPEAVLAERARRRERDPARVSDADAAVVARQAGELQPLDEVPAHRHLVLRADRRIRELADAVEAWLDSLLVPRSSPGRQEFPRMP